jgi:hypothetical protein
VPSISVIVVVPQAAAVVAVLVTLAAALDVDVQLAVDFVLVFSFALQLVLVLLREVVVYRAAACLYVQHQRSAHRARDALLDCACKGCRSVECHQMSPS